jgi:hypothetical protein
MKKIFDDARHVRRDGKKTEFFKKDAVERMKVFLKSHGEEVLLPKSRKRPPNEVFTPVSGETYVDLSITSLVFPGICKDINEYKKYYNGYMCGVKRSAKHHKVETKTSPEGNVLYPVSFFKYLHRDPRETLKIKWDSLC